MMSASEEALLAAAAVVILCDGGQQTHSRRRFWMRPSLRQRIGTEEEGVMRDIRRDDIGLCSAHQQTTGSFCNFLRMSASDFECLLRKVGPHICKLDTDQRKAISAADRLAVTLRYLGTGDSYSSLGYLFKISKQSISEIVPEVCRAVVTELSEYVKLPTTEDEWISVASRFEHMWNFPHCVGAMDGKHITLQAPASTGSEYFNYKGFFSIVMFVIVDAKYNFLYVNVGSQGRLSDGGVFSHTVFSHALHTCTLNLPRPSPLPGRDIPIPYVFVGDDAFPLSVNIMRPYPGQHDKGSTKRIFNYRLSRARRVVENVLGIVSSVFRVLRKPMLVKPETAKQVTLACVHLHNFMRQSLTSRATYTPVGTFDPEDKDNDAAIPGSWRQDDPVVSSMLPLESSPGSSAVHAHNIRTEFTNYFNSNVGRVHWQYQHS